jgi:hypothetical protein
MHYINGEHSSLNTRRPLRPYYRLFTNEVLGETTASKLSSLAEQFLRDICRIRIHSHASPFHRLQYVHLRFSINIVCILIFWYCVCFYFCVYHRHRPCVSFTVFPPPFHQMLALATISSLCLSLKPMITGSERTPGALDGPRSCGPHS